MNFSMLWELFTLIRGRIERSMLSTIKNVSNIHIMIISLPLKNFPNTLIRRILSMSLIPSCTINVTHGVGVGVKIVSVILYSQKMEPLALS